MQNKDIFIELMTKLPTISEKFDMESWRINWGKGGNAELVDATCGFAGCAIGWMPALVPAAKERGFYFFYRESSYQIVPTYKEFEYFRAVAEFFQITDHEAMWLFDAESYKHPDYDTEEDDDYDCYNNIEVTTSVVVNRMKMFLEKESLPDNRHPEYIL